MNILLVSKQSGRSKCLELGGHAFLALVVFAVALPVTGLYAGYRLGTEHGTSQILAQGLEQEIAEQRAQVAEASRTAEENLNALTLRLGQMQAHVIRLDALGQRLTRIGGLDNGEFDFSSLPAQGGPEGDFEQTALSVPDFMSQLDELSQQLESRDRQLTVLETLLMNRNLQAEVHPRGKPIQGGWLSSRFGWRNDPFTGKKDYHKGVDFAGKEGSDVMAVGSGVVTWAGDRYGYGNLVEVTHGNGYVTRYGHCKEITVNVGDTVKKGQLIATMGSTGRSTGPHVHFEVILDSKTVNPSKYLKVAG
ncbi:M23 family metallopeptidase [Thiohalomonas denitrificans]|uniref:Peptidase family M23 n=1 Tax=Thiohalomonas denitrificans TaxID=415747 RepID=A0A1G5PLP3_9GAMM|nr:M23 family metallopeptidase [Thiohalomonas denitrificans]SCZ50392.1 Peptidase family M23 [Thiohalomonas denitrificans]